MFRRAFREDRRFGALTLVVRFRTTRRPLLFFVCAKSPFTFGVCFMTRRVISGPPRVVKNKLVVNINLRQIDVPQRGVDRRTLVLLGGTHAAPLHPRLHPRPHLDGDIMLAGRGPHSFRRCGPLGNIAVPCGREVRLRHNRTGIRTDRQVDDVVAWAPRSCGHIGNRVVNRVLLVVRVVVLDTIFLWGFIWKKQ